MRPRWMDHGSVIGLTKDNTYLVYSGGSGWHIIRGCDSIQGRTFVCA